MSLVGCSFERNTLFPSDIGSSVIEADANDPAERDTEVRLEGCTFSNNTPSTLPILLADNRAEDFVEGVFYSDSTFPSVCAYEGPVWPSPPPPCVTTSPKQLELADTVGFLNTSNAWLLKVHEVIYLGFLPVITNSAMHSVFNVLTRILHNCSSSPMPSSASLSAPTRGLPSLKRRHYVISPAGRA